MGEKYNGWTNYETWCVNLWMDNDLPQQRYWADEAHTAYRNAHADATFTREERAAFLLSDRIKAEYETAASDMLETANFSVGPFADLLRAALSEVNWHEIAKHWIEAYRQQEV